MCKKWGFVLGILFHLFCILVLCIGLLYCHGYALHIMYLKEVTVHSSKPYIYLFLFNCAMMFLTRF